MKNFRLIRSATITLALLLTFSCSPKLSSVQDFAEHIARYSPPTISKSDPVWFELTTDVDSIVPMTPLPESVISISDGVKGTCYWKNSRTIEFRPDEGALKMGKSYVATLHLGKIKDVKKELANFSVAFEVQKLNYNIAVDAHNFSTEHDDANEYSGEVTFNETVDKKTVEKIVTATQAGKSLPVTIEPSADPKSHRFTVSKIRRTEKPDMVTIRTDAKSMGGERSDQITETVPAITDFSVYQVRTLMEPVPMVEVVFTDQLQEGQDLRGFFSVNNGEVTLTNIKTDGNKVRLSGDFPSTGNVSIEVHEGIASRAGRKIAAAKFDVSFVVMPPSLRLLRSGNIMPDAGELLLPIETRNLKALTVIVKQVFENNLPYFLQDGSLSGSNYRFTNYGRVVLRKKIELSVNRDKDCNELKINTLDLTQLFERSPGSIYRIEVRVDRRDAWTNCDSDGQTDEEMVQQEPEYAGSEYYDDEEYYYYGPNWNWEEREDPCKDSYYMMEDMRLAVNLFASNIGLLAKSNSSNSQLLVIANNIMTTQPIAGCKIDVYDYQNQQIGSGSTDAEGAVTIPCTDQKPFLVLATNGKERGFVTVLDGSQLSTSRFDVGGKEIQKGLKGYIYGERGVWRPGDRIFLTFILDDTEQPLPASHPVVLQLYNPQGQYFRKMVAAAGVNGFYRFDIDTPLDAPTGAWRAVVSVGGVTFTKMLRIETVKPNRLKINLKLNKPSGAPLSGTIDGDLTISWLQGAVGSNLGAQIIATFKPLQTAFKGYEKYEFNSSVDRFEPREIEIFKGKVDGEGRARVTYNVGRIENAPGMLTAEFVTRATEPGGDFSTYVQSESFSPYASYVGIATPQDGGVLETDKKNKVGLVVVDAAAQAVAGAAVRLEIYKIGWRWWWGGTREDMSSYISSSDTRRVVAADLVTNSTGRADYDFEVKYPEWGRYLVVATDTRSGHRSSTVMYVDYPAWRGSSALKDPEGLTMLTFTTDKTEYKVGDKVKVTIPKSSDGQAIVSLENGSSVLKMWRIKTSADSNTETSFEVTPEMAPNIYVAISLLQPYRNTANDLPLRLYGIKNINVVNSLSKLSPVIKMPDVLKSEQPFTVKVGESSGREMTYTLAIVDDGLLDLTAFKTPDAWGDFYARRAHGVKMWDMYDNIMGRFSGSFGALYSIGGSDETINPGKQTNRFVPVVKFLGPFTLKKGSQNSHELTLPQYIGSVRVMVVAGNRGAYGSAEKTVAVRNPLMTLTTLPRVVGPGEEVVMPVNVFALEKGITNATVSIDCGAMFEALTPKTVTVAMDKSGEKLVVFRLKVKNRVGQATVGITATSGIEKSAEKINIAVRNPNPELISQTRKVLKKGEQATLPYNLAAGSTDDWMRLEVSSGVQIDLNRRLDYLMTYPHGCSEQITSGALPQLYLDNFVELTKEQQQRIDTNISTAMNQMYSRQVSSGGVAYWSGDSKANEWITSYVGQFMFEAKSKGYSVMSSFVTDWGAYQRSMASKWAMTADRYEQMTQAYRLYTLALWGMPDVGAMNRMREGAGLAPQAVWNLAMAYGAMGKKDIALQLLFKQPVTFENYSPYNSTYGSSERDLAMVLECWVLLGRNDEAMRSAQVIADMLNKRDEYSTQTIARQLLALSKFAKTMKGSGLALDVQQTGGNKLTLTSKERPMVRCELPVSPATGDVKLTNRGDDPLYATLTWRSIPFVDNSPAKNDGVSLKVNYIGPNGEALSPGSIAQGTDFRVETVVTNTSPGTNYTNLALIQIFPSGWEIINERMLTQSESGDGRSTGLSYQDIRDDRVMSYFDLSSQRSIRITVKLRATYKGRFFMPAYSCKAMYDSSVEARTTGNWVEVK